MDINPTSASRDKFLGKVLNRSFAVSVVAVAAFVIFKTILPGKHGGWSIFPVVDIILLSVPAFGLICAVSIYSFQGWTKNTDEYYEWLVSQGLLRSSYSRSVHSMFPKWMYIWTVRIVPIFLVLCALGLYLLGVSLGLIK
jgi:hypothetical protein